MKKFLGLMILTVALTSAGFAQDSKQTAPEVDKNMGKVRERKPPERENESVADANGIIKRGAEIGAAKKLSLADVLKKPEKFAGETVAIEGVIVRSCKKQGCWMEIAPAKEAKSVRVTFKDHAFFIPLDSAGMRAQAEGVFKVRTLSKAEVDHLVNDDGAKFDNIDEDGTVTEISFEATGVELSKQKK
ncbi:MAG TPA: DUF4920 domain-containing protein [Pyrinomonadaceae bacterium]|nr:DUF4920 domain-containing protein [Pyrinomonadaceae bacterium]